MKRMRTDTLEIAFEEHGPADGWPVILSHRFPYDVRAYDEVAPILASSGAHVIVPYLRGWPDSVPVKLDDAQRATGGARP